MAELLGKWVTRHPTPYLVGVIAVTIGLGYASTGLKSEFSIKDILPRGGSVLEDMNTLEAAVGGSTEVATILVKAELTESRTLLNLHDLTTAFDDELRRPKAAAGSIHESYETLVHDWIDDSGEPGDKYDPELETLFREASPGVELDPELMQEFVDKLVAREPELARFLINDTEGIDTMLLQFPTYLGNPEQTRMNPRENRRALVRRRQCNHGDFGQHHLGRRHRPNHRPTDGGDQHHHCRGAGHPRHLLLVDAASTSAGVHCGRANRARPLQRSGHDGAAWHSLYSGHLDHHGVIDRHRGGLYHPRDSSLPRGICSRPQPGESGYPDPRYDRFGVVGLCAHDGVRVRSADSLAAACFTAVRHHCDHYDRLLPDSLGLCGSACNGGLGVYQNTRLRSMVKRMWDDLDVAIDDVHLRYEEGREV